MLSWLWRLPVAEYGCTREMASSSHGRSFLNQNCNALFPGALSTMGLFHHVTRHRAWDTHAVCKPVLQSQVAIGSRRNISWCEHCRHGDARASPSRAIACTIKTTIGVGLPLIRGASALFSLCRHDHNRGTIAFAKPLLLYRVLSWSSHNRPCHAA